MNATPNKLALFATAGQGSADAKLSIDVKAQGTRVRIDIIGEIYNGWTSEDFRWQMTKARKDGAKDVLVYLNTIGGSVFAANEIVNIIQDFVKETGGVVTGKGGALVASAGTFIAVHCSSFSMASNGSFMIHKPTGIAVGNADDFESSAKLLRNLEIQYADAYAKKTGKSSDDIRDLYAKSDYWMTAAEAKAQLFIDAVDGAEDVTAVTRSMYAAVGRTAPVGKAGDSNTHSNSNQNNPTMEHLKLIATALALAVDGVTESSVIAEIQRLKQVEGAYNAMRDAEKDRKGREKATAIDNALATAVKEMRIAADAKEYFRGKIEAAENTEAAIKEMLDLPQAKSLSGQVVKEEAPQAGIPADRASWTFNDWNEKDVKGLQKLGAENTEAYLKLYNAQFGTNRTEL